MFKNVSGQKLTLFVFDYSTGAPKTGDAANLTAYVSKDDGAVTVLGDTSATELDSTNAKGLYSFDLTQTETNADKLAFSGKSSTANVAVVPQIIYTAPASFTSFVTPTGATGVALSAAGIQAIWDALTSALTTSGSVGKLLADNLNATISSRLASASYTAPLDAAAIRAALGLASANLDTQLSTIDDFLDTEIAAILAAVDTEVAAILALLNDNRSEPGQGNPPASTNLATKVDFLYKSWRNKKDNDGSTTQFYADDGTTVDHKQTTSESGGTVTKGEIVSGP